MRGRYAGGAALECVLFRAQPWRKEFHFKQAVADYRGYGQSGGLPTSSAMLADAHLVRDQAVNILETGGYTGNRYVMGRSMGRHAAFELAVNSPEGALGGVIIESGRPILGNFCHGLLPETVAEMETAYRAKVGSIQLPALVIHGERDTLTPVAQAREMYESLASANKRLPTIPGAGHNDLLYVRINEYFAAIREFTGA